MKKKWELNYKKRKIEKIIDEISSNDEMEDLRCFWQQQHIERLFLHIFHLLFSLLWTRKWIKKKLREEQK